MPEGPMPSKGSTVPVPRRSVMTAETSPDWLAHVDRLAEFRDAGLLTDSELEEQLERLRWGPIPDRPPSAVPGPTLP
jgi:hypothetical protein